MVRFANTPSAARSRTRLERGALEPCATDAFIKKHARRREVIAQGGGRLAEEVDLADDGVFAFLFFRRNSCILGCAFQAWLTRHRIEQTSTMIRTLSPPAFLAYSAPA